MGSEKGDRYFDPDETWKGLAVVITNFLSGSHIREGGEKDHENMIKSFEQLGFKVIGHKDVTTTMLTKLLEEYSKKTDLNCFAFAISSHGFEMEKKEDENAKKEKNEKEKQKTKTKHHAIQMFDGKFVFTHDILDCFSDTNCPGLRNKPKIFFIQACRIPDSKATADQWKAEIGLEKGCSPPKAAKYNPAEHNPVKPNPVKPAPQTTIEMEADSYLPDATKTKDPSVEDKDKIDPPKAHITNPPAPVEITLVPCYNDMLIMFPCPEGYYAFRNRHDGSYMLTLFSEVVDAWCTKYESADLMDMLKDVTLKMSEKSFYGPKEYKTVPSVVHKLRKDVIFKAKFSSRLAF